MIGIGVFPDFRNAAKPLQTDEPVPTPPGESDYVAWEQVDLAKILGPGPMDDPHGTLEAPPVLAAVVMILQAEPGSWCHHQNLGVETQARFGRGHIDHVPPVGPEKFTVGGFTQPQKPPPGPRGVTIGLVHGHPVAASLGTGTIQQEGNFFLCVHDPNPRPLGMGINTK